MRAVTVKNYGGPEALEIAEAPVPEPATGQVRIKLTATAVQPVDLGTRAGVFAARLAEGPPYTLGWDLAGTIDALGDRVTGFAQGDAVVGFTYWFKGLNGTQAEFVVLDADQVAPAPKGFSAAQAATLPLNALTADQALDLLDLPSGATLAITGAAGAVGGFAVELAAQRGLKVVAIASAQDEELVRSWGAAGFVKRGESLPDKVDGVFDAALIGEPALEFVRDNGVFVGAVHPMLPQPQRGIKVSSVEVSNDNARLRRLVALAEQGALALRVAQTYPLDEVAKAHEHLAKGGVRGRIVLTV